MITTEIQTVAKEILGPASIRVIDIYTRYALLLNALDVTHNVYKDRSQVTLSTTTNIPTNLRLPIELDKQFDREGLIVAYTQELPQQFAQGFLIDLVAHFDAWMENLYEEILQIMEPDLDPNKLPNKVRSAWSSPDGVPVIRRMLLNRTNLKAPPNVKSTPDMVFDRYEEMRQLRHALMHSNGVLSEDNVRRLSSLAVSAPVEHATVAYQLLPDGLSIGSRVVVKTAQLLMLRKWAFEALIYFQRAFCRE